MKQKVAVNIEIIGFNNYFCKTCNAKMDKDSDGTSTEAIIDHTKNTSHKEYKVSANVIADIIDLEEVKS